MLIDARNGFPVMVKPAGGGGGIGMAVARDEASLLRAVERARAAAERSFADGGVYLERFLERARHVEVQVLGDRHGQVRHLFERDCSIQRRHQKVIEEAPAPNLARGPVVGIAQRAAEALQRLGYDNIGTVEMLMGEDGSFGFLEVNTRLQVEHAVTEMVTGLDLVAAQIRAAAGEALERIEFQRIAAGGRGFGQRRTGRRRGVAGEQPVPLGEQAARHRQPHHPEADEPDRTAHASFRHHAPSAPARRRAPEGGATHRRAPLRRRGPN